VSATSADISKFLKGLQKAKAAKRRAVRRAVDVFGEHVIGDAQQLVPVYTGFLAASGTTLPAGETGRDRIEKVIGFNAGYAAAVHEVLTAHHEQGQAKFLETAVRENRPKFAPFVAARVKAATGNQGGRG
jgi:hypothetical protein